MKPIGFLSYKVQSIIFIFFLFTCTESCATHNDTEDIEDIISGFYDAIAEGNVEKANNYVAEIDKKYLKELDDDEKEMQVEFLVPFLSLSKWEVKKVEVDRTDNKALVTMQMDVPNIGAVFGRMCADNITSAYFGQTFQNGIDGNYYKKAISELESGNFSYISTEQELRLVFENGQWRLLLNIEKQDRVNELAREGWELYKEGRVEKAKEKLKEALSINKDDSLSKYILEKIERETEEK